MCNACLETPVNIAHASHGQPIDARVRLERRCLYNVISFLAIKHKWSRVLSRSIHESKKKAAIITLLCNEMCIEAKFVFCLCCFHAWFACLDPPSRCQFVRVDMWHNRHIIMTIWWNIIMAIWCDRHPLSDSVCCEEHAFYGIVTSLVTYQHWNLPGLHMHIYSL